MAHFDILLFTHALVFFVAQSDCKDTISAYVDEDVSFDCFHLKPLDTQPCYRLKLTKLSSDGLSSKIIFARPETPKFPNDKRIKWETNKDRPNVLLLTKIQKSDEGEYSCEIWSGWECIHVKTLTLKIKDCQSQVKNITLGSIATLDCGVSTQVRVYNQSWFMLKGGIPLPLTDRFQVNGSTLSVKSALTSDSGWYRCKYMFGNTEQRCMDINLKVQVKFTTQGTQVPTQIFHGDSGKGFSAVHTIAVLAGVVIIAALVGAGLCWKHNNKKVPQETPEYEDIMEPNVIYDAVADDFTTSQSSFQHQDEQMCAF